MRKFIRYAAAGGAAATWLVLTLATSRGGEPVAGLKAPEGFRVELFAGDDLAHDIYSMTLDARGRVVVAGKGYVKTLHDDDGDGRADRATLFSAVPKSGAHGLCFDGDDLLCTGDNSVLRMRDRDGDGQADGDPEVLAKLKHPEHGANGLARGPDGWFYLACGNDAGVTEVLAGAPTSPVQRPQSGAIVRFSPDGKRTEIVAHGFRNIYDLDFDASGALLTVDSDGERDQYLPWYSPTRVFDVATGQHHGWVLNGWQHSWNRPEYFFDSMTRVAELGRGSPTGVCVYQHRQFPPPYRGALYSCCWTLGRVYALRLSSSSQSGATFGQASVFLETTGQTGFAPVDVAVGPLGEMYVAIGGRQTRGSVFRVTYVGNRPSPDSSTSRAGDLDTVLLAPQPLAAWSRARWLAPARRLSPDVLRGVALDRERAMEQRVRAVQVLGELHGGVDAAFLREVARRTLETTPDAPKSLVIPPHAPDEAVVVASLRAYAGDANEDVVSLLEELTRVPDSRLVRRAAWELVGRLDRAAVSRSKLPLQACGAGGDPHVRSVALWAVRETTLPDESHLTTYAERLGRRRLELATGGAPPPTAAQKRDLAKILRGSVVPAEQLEALRLIQLEAGDVRTQPVLPPVLTGYLADGANRLSGEGREAIEQALIDVFPEHSVEAVERGLSTRALLRETARTAAILEIDSPKLLAKFPAWLDATRSENVEDALHLLISLARLPGGRPAELTRATAEALLALHETMAAKSQQPSRNWPEHVAETCTLLVRRDPRLAESIAESPRLRRPEQALFGLRLDPQHRRTAARRLLATQQSGETELEWTVDALTLVRTLPTDEWLPELRRHWGDFALRDAIATALAEAKRAEDRERLVEALGSLQPRVVASVAEALHDLPGSGSDADFASAYQALRQASLDASAGAVRVALDRLLRRWVGDGPKSSPEKNPQELVRAWDEWLRVQRPKLHALVSAPGGVDGDAWLARVDSIEWSNGSAERGKSVFEKRACARCHRAADRLGPDLAGAADRFSRKDLLVAIVAPSRDVSPLYQTSQVVTKSGKTYQGIVVYESPEGTLVQTSPDETVRVIGEEIVAIRKSRQSLMPVGLLNGATDGDVADLYAYMKTLRGK